jgi:S1-C subfamily serine protease
MDTNDLPPKRMIIWRERLKRLLSSLRRTVPFFTGVLAALVALLLYNLIVPGPQPLTTRDVKETIDMVMASATPAPAYSQLVYQQIRPSLILIQTKATTPSGVRDDSLGSGVIINVEGDILTSLHVIANAREIKVTFADGTESTAQVIAEQPENDIAIIRADQPPAVIIPAVLGNPNAMQVGDEAFVVGNPYGLYSSMSAGVISGFERTFKAHGSDNEMTGLIQIDTAVNPGNSGGPLLNRYGHVIGIVEGIVSPPGEEFFIGIGFAVPITSIGGGMGSPPPY